MVSNEYKVKASKLSKKKLIPAVKGPLISDIPIDDRTRGLYERNWQEQCYLIENAHNFSILRGEGGPHEKHAVHYYKLVPPGIHGTGDSIDFGSDIIPSLLSKFSGADSLYTTTPHVVSALVPYIKVYKVFYEVPGSMNNTMNQYDEWLEKSKKKQLSIPFDFNVHTTFKSIHDILQGTSGRTDDVGLKSFTYAYHGKDVITKEILKCEMSLSFNSVEGLVKERTTYVNGQKFTWHWLDLIQTRVISHGEIKNMNEKHEASNYEIKVEMGWSGVPESKEILAPGDIDAQRAFDSLTGEGFKKSLFLTLMSHTIEFNQDGSLELNISFVGRSTSRWRSDHWELLYLKGGTGKDGSLGERELLNIEKSIEEEIRELHKSISVEEAEKKETQSKTQAEQAGVIDLKIAKEGAQEFLNEAIGSSGGGYSVEEAKAAAISNVKGPEYEEVGTNIENKHGPSYGKDVPNVGANPTVKKVKGSAAKILDAKDVSVSQRELYILQFKLQRVKSSRRSIAYQRLFKAMDHTLHRLRMARSELGEFMGGQLTRAEANKSSQPYSVNFEFDKDAVSAEKQAEINAKNLARSREQTFPDSGTGLTADQLTRITLGESDPDYEGDNKFYDTYGKNNAHTVSQAYKEVSMGSQMIDKEKMAKTLEATSNRYLVQEAAAGKDDASRLEGEPPDVMILEYFYLGDLIDALISHINDNPDFAEIKMKDEERQIIFAPFRYEHPLLAGHDKVSSIQQVNLADLPISARYFNTWFRKNFVLKFQDSIRFDAFFKLLIEGLVFGALGEQCYYGSRNTQSNLGIKTLITGKPLWELPARVLGGDVKPRETIPLDRFHPSWTKKAFGGGSGDVTSFQEVFLNVPPHKEWYEYYVLFANSYVPTYLSGNPTTDRSKGIHHIYIGANKGLLKNITFEKINQPSIQAYKIAASGARDVREIYKMKMSMIGNNYFEPGQLVYINPALAGLGSAGREQQLKLQRDLGLGGYFRINTVDGILESGKFETLVAGYWETFGAVAGVTEPDVVNVPSVAGPLILTGQGGIMDVTDATHLDKADIVSNKGKVQGPNYPDAYKK